MEKGELVNWILKNNDEYMREHLERLDIAHLLEIGRRIDISMLVRGR